MQTDNDDYRYNFRLFGSCPDIPASVVSLSDGFRTLFRVGQQSGELFVLAPGKLRNPRVQFRTFVHVIGVVAIVSVKITNEGSLAQSVSVSIGAALSVDGESRVPCFVASNGFRCVDRSYRLSFVSFGEPLVANCDTYWIGDSADLAGSFWTNSSSLSFSGGPTGVSISWQDRLVGATESLVLSTIVHWGDGSQKPVLDLNCTSFPISVHASDFVDVNGTVFDRDGDSIWVLMVVNGDFTDLRVLASELPSGSVFTSGFRLSDFGVGLGHHTIGFYALDATGMVSENITFTTECVSAEVRPTQTPGRTPVESPTASFTAALQRRRRLVLFEAVLFAYVWAV
jgi:hypothetical protein